jgi:hypothetical protein
MGFRSCRQVNQVSCPQTSASLGFDQFKIDVDDKLRVRGRQVFADRILIGFVLDVLDDRLVVLVVYLLDVREGFSASSHEISTSAK